MSSTSHGSNKIPATLIPGDGIGPEIVDAVIEVLEALGAPFVWERQQGGMAGIAAGGDPLPQATLDSIRPARRCNSVGDRSARSRRCGRA